MKNLNALKLGFVALLLSATSAFACPGSMCDKSAHAKGAICSKKDCSHKMNGTMCDKKGCSHKMKGAMCDKGNCSHKMNGAMCHKKGNALKMNGTMCHKNGSHKMSRKHAGHHFLKNIHYTLKNLKISKSDWGDVKLAIASYKTGMKKLAMNTPVKSLQNGKFNRKVFFNSHPMQKKLAAQADLIETVFLLLNKDQKNRFAMLMGASQRYYELHPKMCQTKGKSCH